MPNNRLIGNTQNHVGPPPAFAVGQRVTKYRNHSTAPGTSASIGVTFTATHREYDALMREWWYSGQGAVGGVWESELILAPDPLQGERLPEQPPVSPYLQEWERELLSEAGIRPVAPPVPPQPPTKATLTMNGRIRIEIRGGEHQIIYTDGRLRFDESGDPYIFIQQDAWPEGEVSYRSWE